VTANKPIKTLITTILKHNLVPGRQFSDGVNPSTFHKMKIGKPPQAAKLRKVQRAAA
jgi:hypothetical protein